jgi:hypothetical protein
VSSAELFELPCLVSSRCWGRPNSIPPNPPAAKQRHQKAGERSRLPSVNRLISSVDGELFIIALTFFRGRDAQA